jgi:transcriptional regulator of arginine metabolism
MKQGRHEKILELIRQNEIGTQDELLALLKAGGFDITQATVSRDIKELRLVKTLSKSGEYTYSTSSSAVKEEQNRLSSKFDNLLRESAVHVDYVFNQVVIKCYSGLANAVCAAMDSMEFENIVGTISGDDTMLVILRSENDAQNLYNLLIQKMS